MHWTKFSLVGVAAIAAPAFASPIQWTISEASSGVTVSHQGSSKPAVRGEKVQTGDKVITGPNARAVLVRGEERSEEHTSELQSPMRISYAVFCLKKKKQINTITPTN